MLKTLLHHRALIVLTAVALASGATAAAETSVTGAGSTFVYPILAKWSDSYKRKSGLSINYQSIGSGGGIAQIKKGTVDFGASDMPLKPEDLEASSLAQFPVVIGGDVPVVNLKGISAGQLKLTGPVLANIFLGKVTKWTDPAIAALNKGVTLPAQDISVVHRSDGSGTTFIWTNYLSKVSADWKTKVGEGTSVEWPVGVGGKGNEGVSATVQQISGSIGYVEYAYALQNKMTDVQVQNRNSEFVHANTESFAAAAAGADWAHASGFYLILTDQPAKGAWPITGSVFVLMHKTQSNPATTQQILKFFSWAYSDEGAKLAGTLDYVPMPAAVVKQVQASWSAQLKDTSGKPIWP
ncbi:MAG: phosphate ABC transporter substrate-binding protein PstS [Steroidobacteraceae bacterium]